MADDSELTRSELSVDDRTPRRFALAWWLVFPLAFFVGGQVWLHRLKMAESAAKRWDILIIVGSGLAAALLLSWLVWRLGRTSRGLATAIFSGLLILFVLGAFNNRDRQADLLAQQIASDVVGQSKATRDQFGQLDAKLRVAGLGPERLTSIEAINDRLRLLATASRNSSEMYERMQKLPAELRRRMAEKLIHPNQIDRVVNRYLRRMQYDQALQSRQAEVQMLALLRDDLTLLKTTWGQWKYDKAADTVKFDDPALNAQQEALAAKMRDVGTTLARLSADADRNQP